MGVLGGFAKGTLFRVTLTTWELSWTLERVQTLFSSLGWESSLPVAAVFGVNYGGWGLALLDVGQKARKRGKERTLWRRWSEGRLISPNQLTRFS